MTRDSTDIRDVAVRRPVRTGIEYHNPTFLYWRAAKAAGLDLFRWRNMGYPVEFMEEVIAHHNIEELVSLHEQDAINAAQEREAKRNR